MSKVVVLGGCGAVGSVAVRTLAALPEFDEVVIGDINVERANEMAAEIGTGTVRVAPFDAGDRATIRQAIEGADIVLNCVGPFYNTVKPILETVLEAGIDYIDVCDDVDVTLEILGWGERATAAGVTAVIGMGNSPGATNLLAKFAATTLLGETDSIDIFHAHGGEPFEGPGVIGHRFHCMSIPIPMFLEGELKHVNYFEPDGIALRQTFSFPVIDEEVLLYPYPHPEQVTLPDYLDVRQVTNKGAVLPAPYYDLTRDVCAAGLASREPVRIGESEIAPYDFAVAYILRERERILRETEFGGQRGCCSVVAKGRKHDGTPREYRFHMASRSQALGEGTGIPAALGTLMLQQGKVKGPGVFPPEGCMDPGDFITAIPQVMALDDKKEGGEAFGGVIVESVDEHGNVKKLDFF